MGEKSCRQPVSAGGGENFQQGQDRKKPCIDRPTALVVFRFFFFFALCLACAWRHGACLVARCRPPSFPATPQNLVPVRQSLPSVLLRALLLPSLPSESNTKRQRVFFFPSFLLLLLPLLVRICLSWFCFLSLFTWFIVAPLSPPFLSFFSSASSFRYRSRHPFNGMQGEGKEGATLLLVAFLTFSSCLSPPLHHRT